MVNLSLYNLIKFQMRCNSKVKSFYKIIFLYIVTGEVGRQAFEEIQLSTHGFQGLQVRKQDIGCQSFVPSVVCKVDKTEKKLEKVSFWVAEMFYFYFIFFFKIPIYLYAWWQRQGYHKLNSLRLIPQTCIQFIILTTIPDIYKYNM